MKENTTENPYYFYDIKMGEKRLKFDNIEINKKPFHDSK